MGQILVIIEMGKKFLTDLLWILLFLFFLFLWSSFDEYVYARLNIHGDYILYIIWGLPLICGGRVSYMLGFSGLWFCFGYASIIFIAVFVFNFIAYSFHQASDFPGWVGGIWIATIFFTLSFAVMLLGCLVGAISRSIFKK